MVRVVLFCCLFLSQIGFCQIGMGEWRFHVNTHKALDVVCSESFVFVALENGILQYDPNDKEFGVGNRVNGLSDIRPTKLFFLTSTDELVIGYENGNLDFLKGTEVENLPSIRLASIPNSKKINSFYEHQGFLYAATDFAIVKIDPLKKEIKDTYYPTDGIEPILDIYIHNDTLYGLTPTRLVNGYIENPALPDPSQWSTDNRIPIQLGSRTYAGMEFFNNNLCVLDKSSAFGSDSIRIFNNGQLTNFSGVAGSIEINSIAQSEGKLLMNNEGSILVFDQELNLIESYSASNFDTWFSVSNATFGPLGLWSADLQKGLVFFPNQFDFQPVEITGTRNSFFYSMDWSDNRLAVASGYLLNKLPAFTKNGVQFFEDFGNAQEEWQYNSVDEIGCWSGSNIWDFLDISIHPKNKEICAVSTYSEVPLTIMNGNDCRIYDDQNSTLQKTSAGNGWTLVSDVCYDERGNLWCLNGYSEKPLNVLTVDSVWFNFDIGINAKNKYTKKMIIDFQDNLWLATENAGLFGFNYGEDIENIADDAYVNLTTGGGQGSLPSNNITAIAADFDGEIWIGTDAGFAILYGSNSSFQTGADIDAQRVKINFEGNVEYVLGSTHITDIEVDGGNRKWMGTATSGIILLSADGAEILAQFTSENSPLISNVIYDLKLNQNTGELFIITDKGLVSYRTNSSYEDPTYASCKVFPNPVRPGYDGLITIQGIRYDSDVKITDASGNLIYKTTSNGGTAVWDGKTPEGNPVASGVYYFWTARNEGKGRKVGKVVVVR